MPIPPEIRPELNGWIQAANKTDVIVTRHVDLTDSLYVFCDSSSLAWVVKVYNSNFEMLVAKGGLIPHKATIPRGELLALYQATLIVEDLEPLMKKRLVNQVKLLTDSEANVHRLTNDKLCTTGVYERNRIKLIKDKLRKMNIQVVVQHIAGTLNLADYATRYLRFELARPTIDIQLLRKNIDNSPGITHDPNELQQDEVKYMTLRSNTRFAKSLMSSSPRFRRNSTL